jgi:hypothetical protein
MEMVFHKQENKISMEMIFHKHENKVSAALQNTPSVSKYKMF